MKRGRFKQAGSQDFLKRLNRARILGLLRSHGSLSRTELASLSGLDNKTITNIINHYIEKRVVVSKGPVKSSSGRRKEHLKINPGFSYAIGIDLGASHVTATLLNLEGRPVAEKLCAHRSELNGEIILEKLLGLTRALIDEAKLEPGCILGIGFTAPGFFDKERGIWKTSLNITGWNSLPIRDLLSRQFHTDVYLQNCSRSMALAEMWYGEGKNLDDFILLDLGQGIGLGIVIDGSLYEGAGLKSGEIGHLVVDPGGRMCACGNRGCLEASASGNAIASLVREEIGKGTRSMVADFVNNHIEEITAAVVVEAANFQDPLALVVLGNAGRMIGKALSYAVNLFNPEAVIIGGQLSKAGPVLLDPLFETARRLTLPRLFGDLSIKMSSLGHLSASIGAATFVMNDKVFGS
jgi:predicted NBD/HSP70 family sugar kinase